MPLFRSLKPPLSVSVWSLQYFNRLKPEIDIETFFSICEKKSPSLLHTCSRLAQQVLHQTQAEKVGNLAQSGSAYHILSSAVRLWRKVTQGWQLNIFLNVPGGTLGSVLRCLEGWGVGGGGWGGWGGGGAGQLVVGTCSLSLTVLLRNQRRMEAITSTNSWERAKSLHINQHED